MRIKKPRIIDPLSPIDTIASVLLTIIATLVVLFGIAFVLGEDVTFFDAGSDPICTSSRSSLPDDGQPLDAADRSMRGLRDGVDLSSASTEMCQSRPSVAQTAFSVLAHAPSFLVFVGFLALTRRTIRFARRTGIFSSALALRIERLGFFLLFGLVVAAATEWLADGLLKASMSSMGWTSGEIHLSIAGVIGAYGIISIGRVMDRAAALQADADTTI